MVIPVALASETHAGRKPAAGDERGSVKLSVREIPGLELGLLRRGVDTAVQARERCGHCHRTPLVGERMYLYKSGRTLCELCRALRHEDPASSHLVHGPAFGHAVRITDQRGARRAAGTSSPTHPAD